MEIRQIRISKSAKFWFYVGIFWHLATGGRCYIVRGPPLKIVGRLYIAFSKPWWTFPSLCARALAWDQLRATAWVSLTDLNRTGISHSHFHCSTASNQVLSARLGCQLALKPKCKLKLQWYLDRISTQWCVTTLSHYCIDFKIVTRGT